MYTKAWFLKCDLVDGSVISCSTAVNRFKNLYRHDVVQGEARVLCAQLGEQFLQQLSPTLSQATGEVGFEGLHQLTGNYRRGSDILQNSNFLNGEHEKHDNVKEITCLHACSFKPSHMYAVSFC